MKCRRLQLILLPLSLHSILAAPQQGNAGQNKAGFDNDDVNVYDDDKETLDGWWWWWLCEDVEDENNEWRGEILFMLCGVCTMHSISIESLKQNIRDLIFMWVASGYDSVLLHCVCYVS